VLADVCLTNNNDDWKWKTTLPILIAELPNKIKYFDEKQVCGGGGGAYLEKNDDTDAIRPCL
jgi:hypothetical protein